MKKKMLALLLAGLTAFTAVPVFAEEAGVDTVTFMAIAPTSEVEQGVLDKTKALFEEMYPGVTLEIRTGTMAIEDGSLTTMLNSGEDLPDALQTHAGISRIGALADAGLIRPLNDLYEKNGWEEKCNPAALALCSKVDGQYYEVPNTMDSLSCCYNKEIFAEVGVEVPTTWEEFLDVCQKVTDAGYEAITVGAMDGYAVGWLFGNILQSTAGTEEARKLLMNESKWTDEVGVNALKCYGDLIDKGYISSACATKGEDDAVFSFINGEAAMYIIGTWIITDIYDNNMEDKVDTFPMPSQVGEQACATSGLGMSFVVPSGLESTEGAEMWFNFVLSDEYGKMMADEKTNHYIHGTKAFLENEAASPFMASAKEAIAGDAGRNPSVFIGTATKNAYFQSLQGMVAGIISWEEAAETIQAAQDQDIADAAAK